MEDEPSSPFSDEEQKFVSFLNKTIQVQVPAQCAVSEQCVCS